MDKQMYKVPCIFRKISNPEVITEVSGSKSITNRALLLATLAEGKSILRGVLFSDDTRHFLQCMQDLGFETKVWEEENIIEVTGLGGNIPKTEASIYVGSAGTAARFLTACLGVSNGKYRLDASEQMKKRPMAALLHSLEQLGCKICFEEREGFFPFTLQANGFSTYRLSVDIAHSSQFLSALLISACLAKQDLEIQVEGRHGMAYIEMTKHMMEQFGLHIEEEKQLYRIRGKQKYQALDYQIEPDVSAACYFYAMAALLGISVKVKNVYYHSLQGDIAFLGFLQDMGCKVQEQADGIVVTGNVNGDFRGIEADMSACSDQAITLAALAPFASSPTKITGIGHIRYQESNRMQAIVTELRKMGITCEMGEDFIQIYPANPKPSVVETYDDHRMAMGFSLIGLRAEGIVIKDPNCCRKTFENYFEVLDKIIEKLQ